MGFWAGWISPSRGSRCLLHRFTEQSIPSCLFAFALARPSAWILPFPHLSDILQVLESVIMVLQVCSFSSPWALAAPSHCCPWSPREGEPAQSPALLLDQLLFQPQRLHSWCCRWAVPHVLEQGDFQGHRYASALFGGKPPQFSRCHQMSQKGLLSFLPSSPPYSPFLVAPPLSQALLLSNSEHHVSLKTKTNSHFPISRINTKLQ